MTQFVDQDIERQLLGSRHEQFTIVDSAKVRPSLGRFPACFRTPPVVVGRLGETQEMSMFSHGDDRQTFELVDAFIDHSVLSDVVA